MKKTIEDQEKKTNRSNSKSNTGSNNQKIYL